LNARLETDLLQYGDDICVDVIERWPSGPMVVMEILSVALCLAHPELDRVKGVNLLTEMSTRRV
jgi:hypothetical protein